MTAPSGSLPLGCLRTLAVSCIRFPLIVAILSIQFVTSLSLLRPFVLYITCGVNRCEAFCVCLKRFDRTLPPKFFHFVYTHSNSS